MFLSILHHCSLQCFCYSSFLEVWRGELFLGGAHLPKFYARGLYTELRIRLHSDQIIRSRGFSCIGMLYEDLCLAHATQHSHSVRSSHWLEAGVCSAPACVPCPACWLLAYVWQHAVSTLLGVLSFTLCPLSWQGCCCCCSYCLTCVIISPVVLAACRDGTQASATKASGCLWQPAHCSILTYCCLSSCRLVGETVLPSTMSAKPGCNAKCTSWLCITMAGMCWPDDRRCCCYPVNA